MNRLYVVFLILLIFTFPIAALAGERPLLRVSFKIEQSDYLEFYSSSEIHCIEKEGTEKIMKALQDCFGFLQFTDNQGSDSLIVTLDDRDKPRENDGSTSVMRSVMREVGFRVTAPHISGLIEPPYWPFVEEEFYNVSLDLSASKFIKEVAWCFETGLDKRRDSIVKNLFSKIVIADKALRIQEEQEKIIWVLPFTREGSCIDDGSQFEIKIEFGVCYGKIRKPYKTEAEGHYELTDAHSEYYLGILTKAVDGQDLNYLKQGTPMEILGVYITKYIKYIPYRPPEIAKPSDFRVKEPEPE